MNKLVGWVLAGQLALLNASAATSILWQASAGGSDSDVLFGASGAPDGGTAAVGQSFSGATGNKTSASFGDSDVWLIRYDANGQKLWDRAFGGSGADGAFSIVSLTNAGFLLAGYSESGISGNKSSSNYGVRDFWVVKTDANGGKVWDKAFGGSKDDTVFCIIACSEGGSLCVGESLSSTGSTKTSPHYGGADFWIVRLDDSGAKLWEKSFGGSGDDTCYSVSQLPDGGFVLGGASTSGNDGNKTTPNFGLMDVWVLRLDAAGNKLWETTLGGAADDGYYAVSIAVAPDGGCLVAADSSSPPGGNKTSSAYGLEDYWLIRLDKDGKKLWERSLGGSGSDYPTSLQAHSDGGWLVAGASDSRPGGTKTAPSFGLADAWLLRIDSVGALEWDQAFGGANEDGFYNASLFANPDGTMFLGVDSSSPATGNKSSPLYGDRDFWVLKLRQNRPPVLRADPASKSPGAPFRFFLRGEPGVFYRADYCTNLVSWRPFSTNLASEGDVIVLDSGSTNSPARLYRTVELPAGAQ